MQCLKRKSIVWLLGVVSIILIAMSFISCSDQSIVVMEEDKIEDIKKVIINQLNPSQDTERLINQYVGKDLLDITLRDAHGKNVNLIELVDQDEEFILEFMAPWCPGCINAVDVLKDINKEIRVINVALGTEDFSEIKDFKETSQSDLEYFIAQNDVQERYNLMYIPTAFYIKDKVIWGVFDSLKTEDIRTIRGIIEGV